MKVDVYHDGKWLCQIGGLKPKCAVRDAINTVRRTIELANRPEINDPDIECLDPNKLTGRKISKRSK